MKRVEALGYAILSLLSANNAYQFLGTDYHTPYNIWKTAAITFGTIAFVVFLISLKEKS